MYVVRRQHFRTVVHKYRKLVADNLTRAGPCVEWFHGMLTILTGALVAPSLASCVESHWRPMPVNQDLLKSGSCLSKAGFSAMLSLNTTVMFAGFIWSDQPNV